MGAETCSRLTGSTSLHLLKRTYGTTATGICDLPTYNDPNRLGNVSPDPVAPILPGGECSTPIMKNLNGGFWVGSPTPGDGVQVQSNDWGLYLDNGVHLKFNSPP